MTYADLINQLSKLTQEQLEQKVTIFVEGVGESYTALDELSTKSDEDENEIIVLVI